MNRSVRSPAPLDGVHGGARGAGEGRPAVNRLGLAIVLAAAGCGGGGGGEVASPKTFSTDWINDDGKSIEAVRTRLRDVRPGASTDLVVAVAGTDKIVGVPLGGGATWKATHALDARPVITGSVVVVSGGNEVAALDAATGKRLWARPTPGAAFLGAGDDGALTAVALSRGAGSTLLLVARDGTVKRKIDTDKQIGAPAVLGGVVFVPWGNQYVSALDGKNGEELGRVVLRDKVSRATSVGGALYFGEQAYVRFDDKIGQASHGKANRIALPARELPGTPRWVVPGTERLPVAANARDRSQLFARPNEATPPGLDANRFYANYYQLVFGFESEKGRLAWVRTHGAELIGGEAIAGGMLLCDEEGKIVAYDAANGQTVLEKSVGEPIASCVVQADTFRAPRPTSAATSLGQQITEAVTAREATLATAQRLLLRELAALEDESATKTLIDIASDPRSVPVLVADARAALAARRNGTSHMLAALGRRYDFLHDVLVSPPVGPIADALAAMKEAKAASLLAESLFDPQITEDDVKRVAAALAIIATDKELPALKQFFAMYRATAPSDPVALAVGSIGEAMLRVDPKGSRPLVEAAARDAMTVPVARDRLEAALAGKAK